MHGVQLEPRKTDQPAPEQLLGPFPPEPLVPNTKEQPPQGDKYGPRRPSQRGVGNGNGAQVDPNSYDVPITQRFPRRAGLPK